MKLELTLEMLSCNNGDITPAAGFLEGFFPARANGVTAILFSGSHWRSRSLHTHGDCNLFAIEEVSFRK